MRQSNTTQTSVIWGLVAELSQASRSVKNSTEVRNSDLYSETSKGSDVSWMEMVDELHIPTLDPSF